MGDAPIAVAEDQYAFVLISLFSMVACRDTDHYVTSKRFHGIDGGVQKRRDRSEKHAILPSKLAVTYSTSVWFGSHASRSAIRAWSCPITELNQHVIECQCSKFNSAACKHPRFSRRLIFFAHILTAHVELPCTHIHIHTTHSLASSDRHTRDYCYIHILKREIPILLPQHVLH